MLFPREEYFSHSHRISTCLFFSSFTWIFSFVLFPIHLPNHPSMHLCTHISIHSPTCTHSPTSSLSQSLHPSMHPLTHLSTNSFTCSVIQQSYSFIYSDLHISHLSHFLFLLKHIWAIYHQFITSLFVFTLINCSQFSLPWINLIQRLSCPYTHIVTLVYDPLMND